MGRKHRVFDLVAGRPDVPLEAAGQLSDQLPADDPGQGAQLTRPVGDDATDQVAEMSSVRSPDARALYVSVWASLAFTVVSLVWGVALSSRLIVFDGVYSFVGVALSLLGVLALRAARKGPDERYPWGREVWEPLAIMLKAAALGGLCVYALIASVIEILRGGRELSAGWAVLYALIATVGGFVVSIYLRRRSAVGSDLVRAEAAEWWSDTLLSLGALGGFLLALGLQAGGRSDVARYVDPVLVALISAMFLRVPARLLAEGMREVLTMSPAPEIQEQLQSCVHDVEADYGFVESFLRTSKVGSRLDVEVDFVVDGSSNTQTVRWFDDVRQDLQDRFHQLGYTTSMTVSLTADRKWATSSSA